MKGIGKLVIVSLVMGVAVASPATAGINGYNDREAWWFSTNCPLVRGEVEEHQILGKSVPRELKKLQSECAKWERDLEEYQRIKYPRSYNRMR